MPATASPSPVDRLGLGDQTKYRAIKRVAILDAHEPIKKTVYDPSAVSRSNPSGVVERMLTVTPEDLEAIAANSNKMVAAGRPPALQLGHSPLEEMPEAFQPKPVGFVTNYSVGSHEGRPCLFADLLCQAALYDEASSYPNLSVERCDWGSPLTHRIDAVALLRRAPERDLPKVSYEAQGKPPRVLYSKELPLPNSTALLPGELVAYADKIMCFDPGTVHRRLLADRAYRANYAAEHRRMMVVEEDPTPGEDHDLRRRRLAYATKHGISSPTELRSRFAEAVAKGRA